MQKHVVSTKEDYDKTVKLSRKFAVECYSPSQMRDMYPHGGYTVVAEAADLSNKDEVSRLALSANAKNEHTWKLAEAGAHSKLFYKRAGYAVVNGVYAEGGAHAAGVASDLSYVVLLKSRKPLLIWLALLTLLLALTLLSLLWMQDALGEDEEVYNPLPATDTNSQLFEEGAAVQSSSQGNGGSVSLKYSLKAKLDLSTGAIDMYFANPSKSNQAVVLELSVVDSAGSRESVIATSGLIEAGSSLSTMQFAGGVGLSAGKYEAKYSLVYYNPQTGERAMVETTIDDVELTVTN